MSDIGANHKRELYQRSDWVGLLARTVEGAEADRQTSQATQRSDPMNLKQGQDTT